MIIVFGALNMDMLMASERLPVAGETVLCADYTMMPGGKGGNQAFAAARMNERVVMVGKVGDDGMGVRIQNTLKRAGVLTTGVGESEKLSTGCAVVVTDKAGQNQIIVAIGANSEINADQVPVEILDERTVLLMQMEIPAEQNWALIDKAKERDARAMLNLAPFVPVPEDVLIKLDYLVVNEIEAAQAAKHFGIKADEPASIARALAQKGKLTCIVTLGANGSLAVTAAGEEIAVPALAIAKDEIIDTTGAGDAYCGTLAAMIHAGRTLDDAMRHASAAGSLACTQKGAMASFAFQDIIEDRVKDLQ